MPGFAFHSRFWCILAESNRYIAQRMQCAHTWVYSGECCARPILEPFLFCLDKFLIELGRAEFRCGLKVGDTHGHDDECRCDGNTREGNQESEHGNEEKRENSFQGCLRCFGFGCLARLDYPSGRVRFPFGECKRRESLECRSLVGCAFLLGMLASRLLPWRQRPESSK